MKRSFSFDICRDLTATDVSADAVVASLNSLRPVIGDIDIINDDHLIEFSENDTEAIRPRKLEIPHKADFAIVITDKPLSDGGDFKTKGFSYAYPDGTRIGMRVSIVSTYKNLDLEVVTDHEVGHLFNMVSRGDKHDGNGHCADAECMMHASLSRTSKQVPSEIIIRQDVQSIAEGEIHETYVKKRLCQACEMIFAVNAEVLHNAKQGKRVARKLIFASLARAGQL